MWHSPRLGPLFFIIYLNDFEECLKFSSASMYADDTHMSVVFEDINKLTQLMNEELENISEWVKINKLSANPKLSLCLSAIHVE